MIGTSRSPPTSFRSPVQSKAKKNTVLTSHGRPPWYDEDGKLLCDAFVVGVAGGSASGKTHVAQEIVRSLGSIPTVVILSQDSFYKWHTPEETVLAFNNQFDFDHPDAIDMPLFAGCLADLKACRQTNIPVYSFAEHQRQKETSYLYGAAVVITEGIMALHDPGLRKLYDLKIFVQCDSDLMLARRLRRDVKERNRSVDGVLEQYLRFVKPSYDNFVGPTARHADIIVPGSDNSVAIELITTHIRRKLDERSKRFRERMAGTSPQKYLSHFQEDQGDRSITALDLAVLNQTPQVKGIYTILRDRNTSRQDFIFFLDRLSMLLSEKALEFLPFKDKKITTAMGYQTVGKEMAAKYVCGISILRSGGPLEKGLTRVLSNVAVGSLLVQSDAQTGEPLLYHTMVPLCLRQRSMADEAYVFLLDALIGTGAAAFMAIRVLLDHGVRQSRIVFVTYLVARLGGIQRLRRAFPEVKIVCGAIDEEIYETWLGVTGETESLDEIHERRAWVIDPGMGQIGDRYYL